MRNALRTAVVGAVVSGTVLTGGSAGATPPGPGVTARLISQTTVGDTDYVLREITVPPGQSTGWHYHDGPVYGFVQKGTLTHYHSDCAQDGVYRKGSTVREAGGPSDVHIGRNEGSAPLVLDVLYVLPHGAPFSEDVPNPGCSFE
ncbi:cupin domain-containing protein [Streptomyces pseudovenezuelae]|uniref:Quercetin dioxygenase-like cupin family protein n=1 Tax=Streptomyces pseudovenezuelae TaxID=67350 RepID=A0ABT6LX70_9ACTN|nr:cupin domain-containing protein [Streptomyces pseudovenezuelae]MDH6220450.1 quercetin dioxygenase-like cupin family protein [Streptomyces pseudovenezuelae]